MDDVTGLAGERIDASRSKEPACDQNRSQQPVKNMIGSLHETMVRGFWQTTCANWKARGRRGNDLMCAQVHVDVHFLEPAPNMDTISACAGRWPSISHMSDLVKEECQHTGHAPGQKVEMTRAQIEFSTSIHGSAGDWSVSPLP